MSYLCTICNDSRKGPDGEYKGRFVHKKCISENLLREYSQREAIAIIKMNYIPAREAE